VLILSLGKKTDKSVEHPAKADNKSAKKAPAAVKDLGPMPKGVPSAYIFFNTEYVKKLRETDKETKQSALMSLAGQKWNTMSEKDKEPYEAMKQKDLKRREKQLAEREKKGFFLLEDGSKSTDAANAKLFKEKKEKKSKNATESEDEEEEQLVCKPKPAQSAYFYFSNEYIAKLREKSTDGDVKQTDYMKMAGTKWSTMTDEQKKPYEVLNEADKVRLEKQKAEIEKKGFFILADGSKSTDEKNIPKKKTKRLRKSLSEDRESKEEAKPQKKPIRKIEK
jgi:hypothetical protein